MTAGSSFLVLGSESHLNYVACWFNYILVFLVKVVKMESQNGGYVLLAGQVADAIATPLVGFLSDRTRVKFGRYYNLDKLSIF